MGPRLACAKGERVVIGKGRARSTDDQADTQTFLNSLLGSAGASYTHTTGSS